jgi:hypothetical protein
MTSAIGAPIAPPISKPIAMYRKPWLLIPPPRSVPSTASDIAAMPAQLPRRAVRTWPIHFKERTNSAADAR